MTGNNLMQNDFQDQLIHFKSELKAQERVLYLLDKKTDRLEQTYEHQHEKLDEVSQRINEIAENIKQINANFHRLEAESAIKAKFIRCVYLVAGMVITALPFEFIINKFYRD
jgi:uncharacterized phage infection (PIP) family protein YhgE